METWSPEIFNKTKALNMLLYIANKLQRKDFHKIFKVMYFSDRDHLAGYGRTITGDTYIAMADGPVPSKIYDICKSVRGDGYFKDEGTFSRFFTVVNWDMIQPVVLANTKVLSKTDMTCINKAISQYGHLSWDEVREKSHDYAWRNTTLNTPISLNNIMLETGNDQAFIDYANENMRIAKSFH